MRPAVVIVGDQIKKFRSDQGATAILGFFRDIERCIIPEATLNKSQEEYLRNLLLDELKGNLLMKVSSEEYRVARAQLTMQIATWINGIHVANQQSSARLPIRPQI